VLHLVHTNNLLQLELILIHHHLLLKVDNGLINSQAAILLPRLIRPIKGSILTRTISDLGFTLINVSLESNAFIMFARLIGLCDQFARSNTSIFTGISPSLSISRWSLLDLSNISFQKGSVVAFCISMTMTKFRFVYFLTAIDLRFHWKRDWRRYLNILTDFKNGYIVLTFISSPSTYIVHSELAQVKVWLKVMRRDNPISFYSFNGLLLLSVFLDLVSFIMMMLRHTLLTLLIPFASMV